MILERFSTTARAILASAEAEARALGHLHVGAEHVLLALVAPPPAAVTPVTGLLAAHGLDGDEVVALVRASAVRRSSAPVLGSVPYAPRTKKLLELAVQEATLTAPAPGYVLPEHLVLAILREGESVAAGVLERHRVRPASVRALLAGPGATADAAPPMPGALRGPLTPGAQRAADLARQLAGDGDLSTLELLLAVVTEREGVGARVLAQLGVDADAVRAAAAEISATGTSDGPAVSATVTVTDGVEVRIDDPALVARLEQADTREVGEVVRRAIEQHLASRQ